MVYQRNEYYWYVVNKIVKVKQCTIIWHVDYLKVSHVDSKIVSGILSDIETEYGNIAKMTIAKGEIHKYIGVTIDYSSSGKVKLFMTNYIGKIIGEIP